jgi:NADH-ubiquinone oxidoreductase chain 5
MILLLGWDGLGLTSFILVIYYQNPNSLAARIITALTNRLGDVAILLSIALTINQGHWLITNIDERSKWLSIQIIFIILAAITKRAQIPFSRWLPAAIAAPTPVSALVHSSTLVTAGVFLLIRFYPFLHQTRFFNKFILIVATSTTFIAGVRAITECDFKKIVALSTLSQLGVIIFSLGANIPWLAFFHITTHALFKALLFICVGSFIHIHRHTQDLRWMGNITSQIPLIISCITIANLSLCGFPFISGFYSKDLIIESSMYFSINYLLIIITLMSLGLTSFYTTRATLVPIIGPRSHRRFLIIEEDSKITTPTVILASIAILSGSILRWINPIYLYSYSLTLIIKLFPFFLILTGVVLCYGLFLINTKTSKALIYHKIHYASTIIWFLVPISTQFIFKLPIYVTHNSIKSIDQGWLETTSGQGSFNLLKLYINNVLINSPYSPINYILLFV